MAQDAIQWDLRSAWKVVIALAAGLLLTGIALAWPAMVRGASPPVITQVQLASSKGAYFYSPALSDAGGTVYFNNLNGQGAGQIITVTVTVSDDNPLSFSGGYAFGITPTTQISTSHNGTTSTWSVAYTVQASHASENGIRFVITDSNNLTDTTTISFSRDIEGPGLVLSFAHTPDADSGGDGFAPLEAAGDGWEDDLTADFSWAASADNSGGSGVAGYQLSSSAPVASAFYTTTHGSLSVAQQGSYSFSLRARDNVGNLSSTPNVLNGIHFDLGVPVNGNLDVVELSGGQYLYISPAAGITAGTLFYNNTATSSFRVTGNTPGNFAWGGASSQGWKVAFSPGWGESSLSEVTFSPFNHTYAIDPLETTSVFAVSYVNKAGGVLRIPINAQLDTSGPSITFTGFTPPNANIGGVRWYRTSGLSSGWSFTTDVSGEQAGVDPSVGRAYWDHSSGTTYDQNQSAPGGDGIFTGVSGNPNGTVVVTVVLTDRVNNPGNVAMTLKLDGTPPVITPTGWSEGSNYLHIIANQLFFSHQMPSGQSATLSGSAADNLDGSGLQRASFSNEANLAGSPPDDTSPDSWSGAYTFASGSTQGDGLAVVTVYDQVGNTATRSFTYTLDATPPVVTYTGVTNPGYDPDGDELNEVGNWYAAANFNEGPGNDDWVFFFDFSDSQTGARSARADWDHSNNPNDQLNYDPGLDGNGVFGTGTGSSGSAVWDDADGVVTVTLRVEDNVGNVGSDHLKLRIDNTSPTIASGSWSESSSYLYANGTTLYFSHQMPSPQQATLSGTANDGSGSGPDVMTFSSEGNLAGSPGPDSTPDNWSGIYTFSSSSSQGDGTASATLKDHLGNTKAQAFTYILDTTPPTTPGNFRITTSPVIPGYYNTRSLGLAWNSASDSSSGLLGYYLGTSNPPTNFYAPGVTSASMNTGSDGLFTFYLQAQDRVANASLTSTGPITVDTQGPQSFITASPEEAQRRFLVQWGADDLVTWPVNFDVQYRINGGAWTPWLSATAAISQYFGPDVPVTVENDTLYEFQARARDYVGNLGDWSPVQGGALQRRFIYLPMLVKNLDASIPFAVFDGFETGAFVGWKTGGVLPRSVVAHPVSPPNGVPPNGGTYAARLGSPSYGCRSDNVPYVPIGQGYIQAYAQVPPSGTPYLRYNYRVLSYDSVRDQHGEWWDRLEVQVNGTRLPDVNGSSLGNNNPYGDPALGPLNCSSLYDSGWQEGAINLSAYAGQTVLLTFFNENHKDGFWNTYSYLDNIRIEVAP